MFHNSSNPTPVTTGDEFKPILGDFDCLDHSLTSLDVFATSHVVALGFPDLQYGEAYGRPYEGDLLPPITYSTWVYVT